MAPCFHNFRPQSLGRERIERAINPEFSKQKNTGLVGFLSFPGWRACWNLDAHVAQLVEHILGKDEVISSILIMGSRI